MLGLSEYVPLSKVWFSSLEGHSLIWPMRVCATEQAMIFKVLVLNRVYNFTIKRLEQGVFLDKPFKECEHLR